MGKVKKKPTDGELEQKVCELEAIVAKCKQTEQALRESESQKNAILAASIDRIILLGTDMNIVWANETYKRELDIEPASLMGNYCYSVFVDRDTPCSECPGIKSLESGRTEHKVLVRDAPENKSGKKYLDSYAVPIKNKAGDIVHIMTIFRDITMRVESEEELRRLEREKSIIMDTSPALTAYQDLNHRIIWVNKAAGNSVGMNPEKVIGRYCYELWGQQNKPCEPCPVKESLKLGKEYSARKTTPDGRTWLITGTPVTNDQGNYIGAVETTLNISDLVQAEQALKQSEEKFRNLTDNSPDIIWTMDTNLKLTYVNKAVKTIRGFSVEEAMAQSLEEYLTPESLEQVMCLFEKYKDDLSKGSLIQVQNEELGFKHKDGSVIPTESKISVIYDEKGIPQILGISRNISERRKSEEEKRKLEAQLQRSQKMEAIGTLAGGVAHDLNNILSGLVSYPELLLLDLPKDSPMRKPIETIKMSGEKAASMVQDLLTLARRGVSTTEVVNLNNVIESYLTSLEYRSLKEIHPNIKVHKDLETDLLNIMGSSVHLSKTVMNLVVNAFEAIPDGGNIYISTKSSYLDKPIGGYDRIEEGDYVIFEILDTGIGISSADMERMFEPFYTKKSMGRSGTGLGMSVVWGTVKDHRGYIDVQSIEGEKTTFRLYFPVTQKELESRHKMPITNYMGRGESVLVVDDIAEQRDLATRILKKLGYDVTTVSSGEKAVEYLKTKQVDLLVLDMIMEPGMDGLETYKKIIEIHPKQKAIIASGYSETERVKEAQRMGVGEYVRKPYVLEKIGLAVRNELRR